MDAVIVVVNAEKLNYNMSNSTVYIPIYQPLFLGKLAPERLLGKRF